MEQNLLLVITAFVAVHTVFCADEFVCPGSRGYFPHPECKKYYACRKRVSTLRECPEKMLFDVKKGNCYIHSAVDCGNRTKPTVTVVTMTNAQEDKVTTAWSSKIHTVTERNESSTQEDTQSSAAFTHTVTNNLIDNKDSTAETTTIRLPEKESSTIETVELEGTSDSVTTNRKGSSTRDYISTTASGLYNTDVTRVSELEITDVSINKTELDVVTTTSKEPHLDINKTDTLGTTSGKTDNVESSGTVLGISTTSEPLQTDQDRDGIQWNGTSTMEDTSITSSHQSELPTQSIDDNRERTTAYSKNENITTIPETNFTTQEILEYSSHMYNDTTGSTAPNQTIYDVSTLDRHTTKSNGENFSQEAFSTKVTEYYSTATPSSKSDSNTSEQLQTSSGTVINITTTLSDEKTHAPNSTIPTTVTSLPTSTQNETDERKTSQTAVVTEETDDYYPDDFECPSAYGRYPHPTDKHKFLHCQEWFPHVMTCPAGLIFDPKMEICVWSRKTFIMY